MITENDKEVLSTESIVLDKPDIEVSEQETQEVVYTDVIQTNGQINKKSFLYKVFINSKENFIATVIATSSTGAITGLKQQFPDAAFTYMGKSNFIMQVND